MIRLIVFDLDGTLVDSLRDLADSANALLVACGAPPLDEGSIGAMVGDGAAALVARAFVAAGVPQPADALDRFLAIYDTKLLDHTRPYSDIPAVVGALSTRTALAVLTNKPLNATRRILSGVGLAGFFDFDAIVGGDGPFARKPDPAGLLWLCARAGVAAGETVMVGDSWVDWETGRHAATQVCVARYGFGFREFPPGVGAGACVIDAPPDLLRIAG